jgi:TatD DNase family protein
MMDPGNQVVSSTPLPPQRPFFANSLDEVSTVPARGCRALVVPAYDRASLSGTLELARRYPGVVLPAFGVNPWYLEDGALEELRGYLDLEETVAVGEVGLDLAPGMAPVEVQVRAFVAQLDMAAERGLPVLVHCRKAHG